MFLQLCILCYQGYGSRVSYHSVARWKVCKDLLTNGEKPLSFAHTMMCEESVTWTTLAQEVLSMWTGIGATSTEIQVWTALAFLMIIRRREMQIAPRNRNWHEQNSWVWIVQDCRFGFVQFFVWKVKYIKYKSGSMR